MNALMNSDSFVSYVRNEKRAMRTQRGVYVRFDDPSSDQLVQLVAMALERSPDVLLSGPEDPDGGTVEPLCENVAPFVWRLNARSGDAATIAKWLYMGNWCLFIGADAGKTHLPFGFQQMEKVLDALFESVGAVGGIVAFHDNTTVWAYVADGDRALGMRGA